MTPLFRHEADDPLSLAKVTIYLPTRRAVRVLRSEFVDLLGGRSAILPVIRPLGETDDDSGYFYEALPATIDLAQPLSNTARLLELARLILAWRNKLPEIVRHIHSDSPLVAPASPADAIWLARNLAELIDSIETEDLDWSELSKLDTGDYAAWWQLTAEFLQIASAFWPERLSNSANPRRRGTETPFSEPKQAGFRRRNRLDRSSSPVRQVPFPPLPISLPLSLICRKA